MSKIKIRKVWLINPKTRVVPSRKGYKRARMKQNLKRIIKNEK